MTVPSDATVGQTASISMDGYDAYMPTFANPNVSYTPSSAPASVTLESTVLRGDNDGNGTVDIGDMVILVDYSFNGGAAPEPPLAGDVDCSGSLDIGDLIYMVDYMFSSGPAPCTGN